MIDETLLPPELRESATARGRTGVRGAAEAFDFGAATRERADARDLVARWRSLDLARTTVRAESRVDIAEAGS